MAKGKTQTLAQPAFSASGHPEDWWIERFALDDKQSPENFRGKANIARSGSRRTRSAYLAQEYFWDPSASPPDTRIAGSFAARCRRI
jgi:hypothetical protein